MCNLAVYGEYNFRPQKKIQTLNQLPSHDDRLGKNSSHDTVPLKKLYSCIIFGKERQKYTFCRPLEIQQTQVRTFLRRVFMFFFLHMFNIYIHIRW